MIAGRPGWSGMEALMRSFLVVPWLCLLAMPCRAQSSFTMPDGVGRAIPVVPTCIAGGEGTVVPCANGSAAPALAVPYLPLGASGNGPARIMVGSSFQVAFPAGTILHGAFLQNPRVATESLLVDHCGELGVVTSACVEELAPGQNWETRPGLVPSGAVTVSAATAGHPLNGARY